MNTTRPPATSQVAVKTRGKRRLVATIYRGQTPKVTLGWQDGAKITLTWAQLATLYGVIHREIQAHA